MQTKCFAMVMPLFLAIIFILSGCAAGAATAATAGYSLKADSANNLTAKAEDRLVQRVKEEVIKELVSQGVLSR